MEYLAELLEPLNSAKNSSVYISLSILVMLVVIFFLYKTYRASLSVEARLAELSSLTNSAFASRLKAIEVNADVFQLNREALGPLARIIDEYCVVTTDANGLITYCNDKFNILSGMQQKQLVGKQADFENSSADKKHSWSATRQQLSPDKVWHGELCLSLPSGTRWLDCFAFPLGFITQGESGFIYFGTDITKVKEHNKHLQQEVKKRDVAISKMEGILLNSEKMASLGVISAGIAHEINNPIAYVLANIRQLKNYSFDMRAFISALIQHTDNDTVEKALASVTDSPISKKSLNIILEDLPSLMEETFEGIDRVQKIIGDLQSFSSNRQDSFSDVDISRCIDISLNLARHEIKNKIQIHRQHDGPPPHIQGSETQLSQVFLNLFVNAAQAMPNGGEINIHSISDNNLHVIRVSDNGPGMNGSTLESIFEPFFTTKAAGQGTGLGLAISQDIIRFHGGEISVTSEVGSGTTFTISLPISPLVRSHAA